eukprot:311167-Chlamydomonas_euryale.AAC.1
MEKRGHLASEAAAAGSFQDAMSLLHRQLGVASFEPLRPYFVDLGTMSVQPLQPYRPLCGS